MTNLYQIMVEARSRGAQAIRIHANASPEICVGGVWEALTTAKFSTEGLESLIKQLVSTAEWTMLQRTRVVSLRKWFGRAGEIVAEAHYAGDGLRLEVQMLGVAAW